MSVEVEKQVTTSSDGAVADSVSQTSTATQVQTHDELQDAQSDRGNAWIWYIVGVVNLALLLRLVFYLFGARAVGFASFLYSVTNPLIAPFRGIFPNPSVDGSHFEMAAFAAIIVYSLLGWIIARLIELATRPASSSKI